MTKAREGTGNDVTASTHRYCAVVYDWCADICAIFTSNCSQVATSACAHHRIICIKGSVYPRLIGQQKGVMQGNDRAILALPSRALLLPSQCYCDVRTEIRCSVISRLYAQQPHISTALCDVALSSYIRLHYSATISGA